MAEKARKGKILTSPHSRGLLIFRPTEERLLSRYCDRPFLRLAVIGALAAALGLAACGRKGPLDPPPGASIKGDQSTVSGQPVMGANGAPHAPIGPNKRIPLDNLLN
jgi:predicted small lipoprotein YifL